MLTPPKSELAPYASLWRESAGRRVAEASSPTRSEFQRDRDRIVHSTAFRRLAHKTQVFVPHEGDHFRTRLTHTIEVAQITRALARALRLDEDLAEALALAHDLGHTPFGHAGEDILEDCLKDHGGFDHNAQALRIVTQLEQHYAQFDGLNLTFETLEGLVKHNGPLLQADGTPQPRFRVKGISPIILDFDAQYPLDLQSFSSAEAQCAAIADDIAYNAHDVDDGLRAGLFSLADIAEVPFLAQLLRDIGGLYPNLAAERVIHELLRRVITRFVEDVIRQSQERLARANPAHVADIRALNDAVVAFSPEMAQVDRDLKGFLYPRMYRHPRIMRIRDEAGQVMRDLYGLYLRTPSTMPPEWAALAQKGEVERVIADYIAGMTDRFALREHERLIGNTPELR
ncbi:MAG: deoxyguanosinetriphosphate triphosphohydrolase [Hyphomicrobiales bacterium]|nr:deoxyguanosinetriphosphate triphosphohydrolase [Hyphomicrobiales bacterium]MDE2113770.1 deoxyguanosinetriphosphate triphosphohydrolase [Hyphomicrobiales bacterium]